MSLINDTTRYYAERSSEYDLTAGYTDPESEKMRIPAKARYRSLFENHNVLEIACGTGYWTEINAATAKSILATDVNPSVVSIARKKLAHCPHVDFQVADAYSLDGIASGFSAAFSHWWWSHIPKSHLGHFLSALHSKLRHGAFVLFVDQLPDAYEGRNRRYDAEGNVIEERILNDGRKFEIVKNFPDEQEIQNALSGIAENVAYKTYPVNHSWEVSYTIKDK